VLRAGRIDRQWFIDLPDEEERLEILKIHLLKPNRLSRKYFEQLTKIFNLVINRTEGYSGAELEELVLAALNKAYLAGRPGKPNLGDFVGSITTPLAKLYPEKYETIKKGGVNAVSTKYPKEYQKKDVQPNQSDLFGEY
jgi:uncharacterized protein YfkK (UPF0435 family)